MPWSRSAKVPARMSSSTIFIALAACMMVSRPKQIALNPSCSNSLGRKDRSAPAHQWIGELRYVETAREAFEFVDALRCLDEDRLRAGVDIALGAPQRLVEAEHRARIGAHADERLGIEPLRHSGPDLGLHDFRRNDFLAGHMTTALGPSLVDRKSTRLNSSHEWI